MERTRWTGLAPDVARDIAGRLHDAADFVRFHAVCKPWRDSRDVQSPLFRTPTNQLLPWLLAVPADDSTPIYFRCIFSKSSYRTERPRPPFTARRIWDNREGVLYGDGTILLYNILYGVGIYGNRAIFKAALLRSGDTKWTLVERTLDKPREHGEFCAAYHGGKILVIVRSSLCRVITPEVNVARDVLVPMTCNDHMSSYNYILESRGELLWVSVYTKILEGIGLFRPLSVFVHALEEEASTPGKMMWVRKDDSCLADRVLFLGSPSSLAIDASRLGIKGGYVFFNYYTWLSGVHKQFCMYKYDLLNDKTEFVERLPKGWDEGKCSWLVPQPAIAPIQDITKSLKAPERKQQQQEPAPLTDPTRITHIFRHREPRFRVLVRNLPLTVDSSQLEVFFSKHGKVSRAEVLYHKKTWCSRGYGFVTMSTRHANLNDALDAFSGMLLDGHTLEVIFDEEERPRCRRRPRQLLLPS
ncbi:hypothetical protein VPH35_107872 [Triticum aestivum]